MSRLARLVGQDLRPLADAYGVTVFRDGRLNKGWAGQTLERYLGMGPDAAQAPDFGDWELKAVPLVLGRDLMPRLKETMAITMFEPEHLERSEFEDSHLLAKLSRIVIVARLYEDGQSRRSMVYGFAPFDLESSGLYEAIKADYEEIRWTVSNRGLHALNGSVGQWVHPRPKGGKNSLTMGFYAHKHLVMRILGFGG
ncbi:MAG: MutH/Sau3AI family endonuclease [Bradymonadia bacterium]